ncbi:MAG: YwbE family protein, partial [Chitinophagales bacterium]
QYQMNGTRSNIKIGQYVAIVLKQDQRTGNLTEGIIKKILTKSATHHHGIKVMLDTGEVGRVKEIIENIL